MVSCEHCEIFKNTFFMFSPPVPAQVHVSMNSSKVFGHDIISVRMLKVCGESVCKTLDIIHETFLESGKFP